MPTHAKYLVAGIIFQDSTEYVLYSSLSMLAGLGCLARNPHPHLYGDDTKITQYHCFTH